MEYTKGEWCIQQDDTTIEIYVPTIGHIAKIYKRLSEDAEANAIFIAKAPRMYGALKSLNEALTEELHDAKDETTIARFEGYIRQVESVLAEAEGKKE